MGSSRPSDFSGDALDLDDNAISGEAPLSPQLGFIGWLRWIWTQLTSMRTALILLLMLAAAAVPGSVYPQRSADPNGVVQFYKDQPQLAQVLDSVRLFDVYTSPWFSAIYILLFISLIGCVVPRLRVHYRALRAEPVQTPSNLRRMPAFKAVAATIKNGDAFLAAAAEELKTDGYRVAVRGNSVSAERGYWRETGNLVFHISLLGVLISVGIGGGFAYSGQRVMVEGDTFVNNLASFDSFSPGVFFDQSQLKPFSMTLKQFEAQYDLLNPTNINTPLDYRATVTTLVPGQAATESVIRVNEPLDVPSARVYLTGNGFAPVITIRDADGSISFSGPTPFLPQDGNLTSLGVIKVPDAKPQQFGALAFFYPTADELKTGAYTSISPQPINPLLTLNVYSGDLGLNEGTPRSVYELDLHGLKQLTGGKTGVKSIELEKGESAELPNGLGTITFEGLRRFASLDIVYNPGQLWVLFFALLTLGSLMLSLLVARRRVWVKLDEQGYQIAALARGDDPGLEKVVAGLATDLAGAAGTSKPAIKKESKK